MKAKQMCDAERGKPIESEWNWHRFKEFEMVKV